MQEAAVIALGKLGEFTPGTSFVAWMGQIVRFVALNRARRREAAPVEPEALDRAAGGTAPPAPLALGPKGQLDPDQLHFDDRLSKGLATLSETARACLLLRTVEGLDYDEISAALGIPPGTAMSHVHRARAQLRKALGEGVGA